MLNFSRQQWVRIGAMIAGGVLTGLAFPPADMTFLAWIGIVPWGWALIESEDWREVLFGGFVAGFVFTAMTLFWLFEEWGIVPTLFFGLTTAFTFSVWSVVTRNFAGEGAGYFVFGGGAFWVALEYGRQYGLWTSPTMLVPQSQATFPPALQILDITGQWGLSLVIVVLNLGLAWIISRRYEPEHATYTASLPLLLVLLTFGYGYYRLDQFSQGEQKGEQLRVAVVQAKSAELQEWTEEYINEALHRYTDLVRKQLDPDQDYDYIIFPEESIPLTIPYQQPGDWVFPELYQLASDYNAGLIFGTGFSSEPIGTEMDAAAEARQEGVKFYNGAQAIGPNGSPAGQYLKIRPVPFGETHPMGGLVRFVEFPWGSEPYSSGRSLKALTTHNFRVRMGTNICYENLYPFISRGQTADGASVLLNLSNYTWFEDTVASDINSRIDTLRAVENRRYYLRASTIGYSQIISPTGRILSRNREPRSKFVMPGTVYLRDSKTVYTRFGDWFFYLCLLGSLWGILVMLFNSRDRRGEEWELLDESRLWQ